MRKKDEPVDYFKDNTQGRMGVGDNVVMREI